MTTPVNFTIAKLLKEKGFNELCNALFIYEIRQGDTEWKLIELFERNNGDTYDFLLSVDMDWQKNYLRPEQWQVVMWIYEKHKIWIECFIDDDKTFGYLVSTISEEGRIDSPVSRGFVSPVKAYEVAIEYTLNNLI